MREINKAGLDLIKEAEGERLVAYLDPSGYLTVGVGHLVLAKDKIKLGDRISQERSLQLLKDDLKSASGDVELFAKVPLTDNQFSALVSFVFNIGGGAFSRSTLLRYLNAKKYEEASTQFQLWNKSKGKVLPGLVIRRDQERRLFLKADN